MNIIELVNQVGGSLATNVFNFSGDGGMYIGAGFLVIFLIYLLATGKVSLGGFLMIIVPTVLVLAGLPLISNSGGFLPSYLGSIVIILISLIMIFVFFKFFRA